VIVIDNDASGMAARVVGEHSDFLYASEKRRGVSHVRNTGVALALERKVDAICFVDDDEVTSTGWLNSLCMTLSRFEADMVAGPVIATFGSRPPQSLIRLGFFDRSRFRSGSRLAEGWTGNLLVKSLVFAELEPDSWFAPSLTSIGGEDVEFTRRVSQSGRKIVWDDQALVFEPVAVERYKFSWHCRRSIRTGFVDAFLNLRSGERRTAVFTEGALRILSGMTMILLCAITFNWRGLGDGVKRFFRGIGFIRAVLKKSVSQYV
jgi:GT2 family glycosyltransferase